MAGFFIGLLVGIVIGPWVMAAVMMIVPLVLARLLEMIRKAQETRVRIACWRRGHVVRTACEYEGGTKQTCARCLKYRIVKDGATVVQWH
jgi:hypothetical protein